MNEIYRNARHIRVTREDYPFLWDRGHRAILMSHGGAPPFPSVAALKRKVDQILAELAPSSRFARPDAAQRPNPGQKHNDPAPLAPRSRPLRTRHAQVAPKNPFFRAPSARSCNIAASLCATQTLRVS